MINSQPDELRSKVTKESLEDVAAKEAERLNRSLFRQLLIPAALISMCAILPSGAWWVIVAAVLGFAVYFTAQLKRLDDLRGRGHRASRRPMRLSRAAARL